MPDRFSSRSSDLSKPAQQAAAITPNDATDIDAPQALFVGTGGTLVVQMMGDAAPVTLTNVANGTYHPLRVRKVLATGTTATGIIAIY